MKITKQHRTFYSLFVVSVIVLILFFISLASALNSTTNKDDSIVNVDPLIIQSLEEDETVSVIITLKEDSSFSSQNLENRQEVIQEKQEEVLQHLNHNLKTLTPKHLEQLNSDPQSTDFFELKRKYLTINALSGEINIDGLEKLKQDPLVEKITANSILHTTLDASVPQIHADDVWNFSINNQRILGAGETVCIVDTGIDTDHSAFNERIIAQHCFCSNCCSGGSSESDTAEDDSGHGTHVAGIAAGDYSNYKGVAPGANLVIVKVCNSQGECDTDDLISGIDWCTSQAGEYNITVISISIGGGGPYNDYCDNESFNINLAIDSASEENISVVVASGNNGFTTGISIPACVERAIPVGGVDSNDYIYYNRGILLDLLAPANSITSPYLGGGTATLSGTSMAAPHVSGAILLLRQYWNLLHQYQPMPTELKTLLKETGKIVNDSTGSGLSFSRIDLLSAFVSLDNITPMLNFVSPTPENNHSISILVQDGILFNLTSDESLSIIILELDNHNESMSKEGTNYYLLKNNLSEGNHTFKVYGIDFANNTAETETRTFFLKINYLPAVHFYYPLNYTYYHEPFFSNITITSSDNLTFIFYNLTDSTEALVQELFLLDPQNNFNENIFLLKDYFNLSNDNFTDGLYHLHLFTGNSFGNVSSELIFFVDKTSPSVHLNSPLNFSLLETTSEIVFQFDAEDLNNLASCSLYLNQVLNQTQDFSFSSLSNSSLNFTLNLQNEFYEWFVTCEDSVGNTGTSETFFFNLSVIHPTVTLISPQNNFKTSDSTITFSCAATGYSVESSEGIELTQMTLYGDWGGAWQANETTAISGLDNSSFFMFILSDGIYYWNCLALNRQNRSAFASENYSLTVDTALPVLTDWSETIDFETALFNWETNEETNFSFNYGLSASYGNIRSDSALDTKHELSLTGLDEDTTYYYQLTFCDIVGNCDYIEDTFTTDSEPDNEDDYSDDDSSASSPSSSSSSSSGGSGNTPAPIITSPPIKPVALSVQEPSLPVQEIFEPASELILEDLSEGLMIETTGSADSTNSSSRSNIIGGAVAFISGSAHYKGTILMALIWSAVIILGIIFFKFKDRVE